MTTGISDLRPGKVFKFICNDFETAWNAVAAQADAPGIGRDNFVFALVAMVLLEWACRICASDHKALAAFGQALYDIRPAYFTPVVASIKPHFMLPSPPRAAAMPSANHCPLLWLLWDLIRNGQAHQYQQMVAKADEGDVYIRLYGAKFGHTISNIEGARLFESGKRGHLAPDSSRRGALGIIVHPLWLYLDLRDAVNRSKLLKRSPKPPSIRKRYPGLKRRELGAVLRKGQSV